MKKFVKIFLFCVVVLGGIALALCYIFLTEQTKSAMDIVVSYVNKPLPIIGVSIVTLGCIAYVIFSKTSYGKKAVNEIKVAFKEFKQECKEYENKAELYYKKGNEHYNETIVVLSEFSERIDKLTNELANVCETSPNVKIKALANQIREVDSNLKEYANQETNKIKEDVEKYVEDKNLIEELQKSIATLNEKIEGLVEKYGEETTND